MGDSGIGALKDILCEWVVKPLDNWYRLLRSLPSTAEELEEEIDRLKAVKGDKEDRIRHLVSDQSKEKSQQASSWLNFVENHLVREVEFRNKFNGRRSNCNCWRCGCYKNCNLAREAEVLLNRARELRTEGNNFTDDQLVNRVPEMVFVLRTLHTHVESLSKRKRTVENLMADLKRQVNHLVSQSCGTMEGSKRAAEWFEKADSCIVESGRIFEITAYAYRCSNSTPSSSSCISYEEACVACKEKYNLSKEVEELLQQLESLQEDGQRFTEEQLVSHIPEMVIVLRNLHANFETLSWELRTLRSLREDMEARVKFSIFHRQGTERSRKARDWFKDSESEIQLCTRVFDKYWSIAVSRCTGINRDASSCYCISDLEACDSCIRGFEFGKRVSQLVSNIRRLIQKGNSFTEDELVVSIVPALLEDIPIYLKVVGQEKEFAEALRLVDDDSGNNMVGIWGMGGSGKSTLLKRINNHFCSMVARSFDVVLYATAGKDSSLETIQNEIAKRLGIRLSERGDEKEHAGRIFRSLHSKKSFLVLLDNLWDEIKLEKLGIPPLQSNEQKKWKIVITARDQNVCYRMLVKEKCMIKMEMLSKEESWQLFSMYLGNEELLLDQQILPVAREVASECGQLPLALETVGKAMSGAKEKHEWSTALVELQELSHRIPDFMRPFLSSLKLSFERLENDAMREILFLCLAFTANIGHTQRNGGSYARSKRGLATIIVAEGLLERHSIPHGSSLQSAYNVALTQISKLVKSSLLMAYGSSKSKVCLHDCVIDMLLWLLHTEKYKSQEYVKWYSSMKSSSGRLQGFFTSWKDANRVSMDDCEMTEIPADIETPECSRLLSLHWHRGKMVKLRENFFNRVPVLRYLDLSFSNIEQLPESIGSVVGLRVLLLTYTAIHSLPEGIGKLHRLIELSLAYTSWLKLIPRTSISTLHNLERLEMRNSAFIWTWENSRDQVSLQDLQKLTERDNLSEIHLGFRSYDSAIISGFEHSYTLSNSIVSLHIEYCNDYGSANVGDQLKTISGMRKLEKLYLGGLDLSTLEQVSGVFHSIKILTIWDCPTSGNLEWITRWAPEIQELHLTSCQSLTIILESVNAEPFPYLRMIDLFECPKLHSISNYPLSFPALEKLAVYGCPELKNLCFDQQSAARLRKIKGSREWWTALQWESEDVKSKFERIYFAPA